MEREPQLEEGRKVVRTRTVTASLSPATHCRLDAFLRQQTELWNDALEERIECHRKTGRTITAYDQMKSLTVIRAEDAEFRKFHLKAQRSVLLRLDKAFKAFFQRVKAGGKPGFPRFKARHRGIRSFDIPDPLIRDTALHVKGIGRFGLKSVPDGKVLQARVVRTAVRVVVQFAVEIAVRDAVATDAVGIDMGVKDRAILSTGGAVPAVRLDRRKLKRKQRLVSRARTGSATKRKKVLALRREHERTKVRGRNGLHRIPDFDGLNRRRISAALLVQALAPWCPARGGCSA